MSASDLPLTEWPGNFATLSDRVLHRTEQPLDFELADVSEGFCPIHLPSPHNGRWARSRLIPDGRGWGVCEAKGDWWAIVQENDKPVIYWSHRGNLSDGNGPCEVIEPGRTSDWPHRI